MQQEYQQRQATVGVHSAAKENSGPAYVLAAGGRTFESKKPRVDDLWFWHDGAGGDDRLNRLR